MSCSLKDYKKTVLESFEIKNLCKKYNIEKMVKDRGFKVVSSLMHRNFNPIELIWNHLCEK